jgi:alpha-ketoglutarate-dependent taurine dioxygenase
MEGRLAHRSKVWRGGDFNKAAVTHRFSPAAQAELGAFLVRSEPLPAEVDVMPLAALHAETEELRHRVEQLHGFAIVEPPAALDEPRQRRALAWLIGRLLGEPTAQSAEGVKVIQVYDRDRSRRMEDGARYHQTRQGGSLHTDNVNRPQTWDYLMMACVAPAMLGGESILVSGLTVYDVLRAHAPRALEVLAEDFWWECRGFSDDFFRAPVLFFDRRGEPRFRYLREYLESAHRRRGEPLRDEQLWALDALDAVLELSELQFRCRLAPGEMLVIDDLQMFHGRTSFSDFLDAAPHDANAAAAGRPLRRCFDRLWIKKRAA